MANQHRKLPEKQNTDLNIELQDKFDSKETKMKKFADQKLDKPDKAQKKKHQSVPASPTEKKQQKQLLVNLASMHKPINDKTKKGVKIKNNMLHQRVASMHELRTNSMNDEEYKDLDNEKQKMQKLHEYLANFYRPRHIQKNVITKYAFATRVGFVPMNPHKVN